MTFAIYAQQDEAFATRYQTGVSPTDQTVACPDGAHRMRIIDTVRNVNYRSSR